MNKKIKCVTNVDGSVIIPIDKIVLIEPEFKRIYIHRNENSLRWFYLSDKEFKSLMRELELIGGRFID